jgi:RES domain-containing protein
MAAGMPSRWDASAAIRDSPVQPWSGDVWRCHRRKYAGADAGGSVRITGRFNRGTDKFDADEVWPALYTGLAPHVALGERLRHTTPASLRQLGDQQPSRLRATLHAVLNLCAASDCAELGVVALDLDSLCGAGDYNTSHRIAEAARSLAEALLVPSCTRFPEGNLIIFPDRLSAESSVEVVEIQDPDLFVDWDRV